MIKQQLNEIEFLLNDSLLSLGTRNCKVNECEGCKVDEQFAKDSIKLALEIIYEIEKESEKN